MALGDPLEPSHAKTGAKEALKVWTAPGRARSALRARFLSSADRSALAADHEAHVLGRAAVGELSCLLHPQFVQRKIDCAERESSFGE